MRRAPALKAALAILPLWLAASLGGCGDSGAPTGAAPPITPPPVVSEARWLPYERPESFAGVAEQTGLQIVMRDGTRLSANLLQPALADGTAAPGPFPVILTQTGYNKSVPVFQTSNEYFVRRGYVHLSVDVRGTGQSEGTWEAFSETEQADYSEVMDWAATQPWSDGRIGTWGASFAAITQLFTAAQRHPAHKAVFAIVPMGDAYRDIVFSGGQINMGFIPLWLGIVTAMGVIPADPTIQSPQIVAQHLVNAATQFQVPTLANALLDTDGFSYDGPYWRTRSPLEVADRIRTPTFIVGGLRDLFQRGQPLLYEALRRNTTTKMLIGPWMHTAGSSGEGLPMDGVPDLDHIALQWYDHWLLGLDSGAERVPNVTQYLFGAERFSTASDWPHPQARAHRWYLHGDQSLDHQPPAAGEAAHSMLQQPLNGVCSSSSAQWTAGALGSAPLPCITDNRTNELLELTYSTAPMSEDYYLNGPLQADLWVSSTATDAGLVVRLTEVAPDGTSREITNGILTASLRAVDPARERMLDGLLLQPWHPFTADSRQPLERGEPVQLSVELFPTSLVIRQGYRLRISIGPSDFPHGLPPLPDLANQAVGVLSIHSDDSHPSSLVVPAVPVSAIRYTSD